MSELETAARMLSPHEFEVLWHLALVAEQPGDATAADRKVAIVLGSLRRRGLVTDSGATDAWLPGRQRRRWRLTEKGERWLRP